MENEPKYMFILLLYFLFLIFVVTMFNGISTEFNLEATYNSSYDDLYIVESYADGPRFSDSSYFDRARQDKSPYPLMQEGYIYDDVTCESYNGFTWGPALTIDFWFINFDVGTDTCRGMLNITHYANGEPFDDSIASAYTNQPICELGLLDTSQEITQQLGCTWYKAGTSLTDYDDSISKESFNGIWGSLKQIATFNINFGIEKDFLNFLLNFLLVGLPFTILLVYVIIIIRKLVGFT